MKREIICNAQEGAPNPINIIMAGTDFNKNLPLISPRWKFGSQMNVIDTSDPEYYFYKLAELWRDSLSLADPNSEGKIGILPEGVRRLGQIPRVLL